MLSTFFFDVQHEFQAHVFQLEFSSGPTPRQHVGDVVNRSRLSLENKKTCLGLENYGLILNK